jgi:flavorubredoxin
MISILNIYDTKYGNTKQIAGTIERILSQRNIFVIVTLSVKNVSIEDVIKADFIIIGSPTNYWRATNEIKKFIEILKKERIRNKLAAVYDTKLTMTLAGGAGKRIVQSLKSIQFFIILPAVDFYVKGLKGPLIKGEIEKSEEFAKYISEFLYQLYTENLKVRKNL